MKVKRRELTGQIIGTMKVWMETESIRYSSNFQAGKAITYVYTRWDNVMKCLEGKCLLWDWDNNLAEDVIQLITLRRKNYLFDGNHEAAANMSVICSLLATCKAHDVNPRKYLDDVIVRMPSQKCLLYS